MYHTADLRTEILDFGGVDSSIILMLRGGILMSVRNFADMLCQRILAGIILVGRLGVVSAASFAGLEEMSREHLRSCVMPARTRWVESISVRLDADTQILVYGMQHVVICYAYY